MGFLLGKKVFFALLPLLLFACSAAGQPYAIDKHVIEINLDQIGNATINERFFIRFQDQNQLDEFRLKVKEIGVNVDTWKAYDSRIALSIGQESGITVRKVSFVEEPNPYLEINYATNEPLMEKKQETTRVIDYSVKTKFFNGFLDGSLWVIPAGMTITINLPSGAAVQQPIEPNAVVNGSSVTWDGSKSSNKLTLNYQMFKQITSFDLGKALQAIMQSDLFWIIIPVLAIACILAAWKRKAVGEKIENYIVAHSDMHGGEEE